ncbi:MAG: hypothetical protein KGH60_03255 [Candidatus Micrarchaeota archaeon]|nr:hypothetical protein [Candidatus Micrarchaeota archaeon]
MRALAASALLLGSAACITSLLFGALPAVPFCMLSLAILAFIIKHMRQSQPLDQAALVFASNLLENWSMNVDALRTIENSLDNGFSFSSNLEAALQLYRKTGDIEHAFGTVAKEKGKELSRILDALAIRIEYGIDVKPQLEIIKADLQAAHGRTIKGIGMSSNAAAITNAGSVVFFPAFAGISLGIIKATTISGQQASFITGMTTVFAGYILITAAIGARYSNGAILVKAARISSLSGLALLILKLASTLQIGAI